MAFWLGLRPMPSTSKSTLMPSTTSLGLGNVSVAFSAGLAMSDRPLSVVPPSACRMVKDCAAMIGMLISLTATLPARSAVSETMI